MNEQSKIVRNPLSIIAIFAGLAEVSSTAVLPLISPALQSTFIWFVMGFPLLLIVMFFGTLNWNHRVLYAPSDFKNEEYFVKLNEKEKGLQNVDLSAKRSVDSASELRNQYADILGQEITTNQLLAIQYAARWESEEMIAHRNRIQNITYEDLVESESASNAKYQVLRFLEEVAVSVKGGMADEALVKKTFDQAVVKIWADLEFIILKEREAVARYGLYENLEWLANRWKT